MRPFPVIAGKMWIMPWTAAATQKIMTPYLQDSRLPYADPALPPAAAAAMREHRQRRNRELEAEAGDVVQHLALPYRLRWTPAIGWAEPGHADQSPGIRRLREGRGIRFGRGEPLVRVLLSCGLVLKEVGQFSDAQPGKPTGG
jgi:hypothetical protein